MQSPESLATSTWPRPNQTAACFGLGHVLLEITNSARPKEFPFTCGSSQTCLPPAQGRWRAGPRAVKKILPGTSPESLHTSTWPRPNQTAACFGLGHVLLEITNSARPKEFPFAWVVHKRAFHRHKAGGGQTCLFSLACALLVALPIRISCTSVTVDPGTHRQVVCVTLFLTYICPGQHGLI